MLTGLATTIGSTNDSFSILWSASSGAVSRTLRRKIRKLKRMGMLVQCVQDIKAKTGYFSLDMRHRK
jgi:hypothetical protein